MSGKQESVDGGQGNTDPSVFSIRNVLEQPDARMYTVLELHIMIHNGEIDLDLPHQRDFLWPSGKQMRIIDSLFHNFYIPPVIFAITQDEDGEEIRICVDGKQRLTSIVRFLNGFVAYQDPDTQKLWWYLVPPAYRGKRNEISPEGKETFEGKHITCVEYRALSPASEREVFQCVQLGRSLSVAEKLQAILSPSWSDYMNQLHMKIKYILIGVLVGLVAYVGFDAGTKRNEGHASAGTSDGSGGIEMLE